MLIIEFVCGRKKFPCRLDVIRQKFTLSLPSVCAAYRYLSLLFVFSPTEALNTLISTFTGELISEVSSRLMWVAWLCDGATKRPPSRLEWRFPPTLHTVSVFGTPTVPSSLACAHAPLDLHWLAVVMVSWFLASRYQYNTVASDDCFVLRVWEFDFYLSFIYLFIAVAAFGPTNQHRQIKTTETFPLFWSQTLSTSSWHGSDGLLKHKQNHGPRGLSIHSYRTILSCSN